jgi:hypothetical protein
VQYVYRSTGLVKGEHPYSIIVDDAKKDDKQHLYQWTIMLAKGVWKADYKDIPEGAAVLAYDENLVKDWAKPTEVPSLIPQKGDPLLFVYDLDLNANKGETKVEVATDGQPDANDINEHYNRLAINKNTVQANYKVLLIPFRYGDELPRITYLKGIATLKWKNQTDLITFDTVQTHRNHVIVQRDGKLIAKSK